MTSLTNEKTINITMTLTKEIVDKIDAIRGDINRSKFVLRILEKALEIKKK